MSAGCDQGGAGGADAGKTVRRAGFDQHQHPAGHIPQVAGDGAGDTLGLFGQHIGGDYQIGAGFFRAEIAGDDAGRRQQRLRHGAELGVGLQQVDGGERRPGDARRPGGGARARTDIAKALGRKSQCHLFYTGKDGSAGGKGGGGAGQQIGQGIIPAGDTPRILTSAIGGGQLARARHKVFARHAFQHPGDGSGEGGRESGIHAAPTLDPSGSHA